MWLSLVGCIHKGDKCVKTIASSAASFDFMATEDTNRDKVNDILFVLRSSKVSQNNTCAGAGKTCASYLITQYEATRVRQFHLIYNTL